MMPRSAGPAGIAPRRWWSRLDGWLSTRFPIVWRTRIVLWAAAGAALAAAAVGSAHTLPLTLPLLSGLDDFNGWLTYALMFVAVVVFIIVVDTFRRVRSFIHYTRQLRVFLCLSGAIFSVSLPPSLFVRALAPRVAGLEQREIIETHAANGFWHCWSEEAALSLAANQAQVLDVAAILRYTDVGIYPNADGQRFLEVSFQPGTQCGDRSSYPPRYRLADIGGVSITQTLLHVDAAQRYVVGDHSAYVVPGISMLMFGSMIVAAFTVAISSMHVRIFRGAGASATRSFHLEFRGRDYKLDQALAIRSPSTWSSRLHATLLQLAAVPAIVTFISLKNLVTSSNVEMGFLMVLVLVGLVSLLIVFHSQRAAKYAPLTWGGELRVFLLHAVAIAAAATGTGIFAPIAGRMTLREAFPVCVIFIALGSLFMAAAIQAARTASLLGTAAAFVGVPLGLYVSYWLAVAAGTVDPAADIVPLWVLSAIPLTAGLAIFVGRMEMRPSVRRPVLASCVLVSPIPTFAVLAVAMPRDSDFTWHWWFVGVILGLISVAVTLRLIRNARQSLMHIA